MPTSRRTRPDRCPGVLRPWPAEDGLLVRVRLVAGELDAAQAGQLAAAAARFGDGRVHTTSRANLQLRAFPDDGTGHLTDEARAAVEATGLVPSAAHDLVRNIMASPLTGVEGGRADLTPTAHALDAGILASERLAGLPGKFLFVLDDGRGDVLAHECDLGLVALDEHTVQLRIGDGWGPVLPLDRAVDELLVLAERFVAVRGEGPDAAWHVTELAEPLAPPADPDPRLPRPAEQLPFGEGEGWRHVEVGEAGIDGERLAELVAGARLARVTPWHGLLLVGGAA